MPQPLSNRQSGTSGQKAASSLQLKSKNQGYSQEDIEKLWAATITSEAKIEDSITRLNRMEVVLVAGFVLLLVMVATIIIMVLLDWKNADDHLLERINSVVPPTQTIPKAPIDPSLKILSPTLLNYAPNTF